MRIGSIGTPSLRFAPRFTARLELLREIGLVLVFFTLLVFLPDVASLCQYCGFAPLVLHAEMNDFKVFTFVEFPGLTDTVADKAYLRVKMHTFV